MNPSGLFGSSQGGAFQAPSSTTKSSLFQAFGQPSSTGQPQAGGFGQSAAFGQPSVFSQPPAFGQTHSQTSVFGQTPAFGQTPSQSSVFGQPSGQPSAFPAMSQPLAFGQATPGFGSTPLAFGQTQGSMFGQTPAVGQPSGFSQATAGFTPSAIAPQTTSGSTGTSGPSQPMSFGQSPFVQQLTTPTSSSALGTAQSVSQNRGFGQTEFSFKPANEAVFKPIFSAGLEASSQSSSSTMESSSTATTTSGFSILTAAKGGSLGFSFSQPAAAASISTQKDPLTTTCSSTSASGLQFTFSQPAAPSSPTTNVASTQPTTPSSFSFSAKALQPQAGSLFGGAGFPQPSAFGDSKAKAEPGGEEPSGEQDNLADTNVFARLGKGTKRKEDPADPGTSPEKPVKEEVVRTDAPRHPPKRPLLRSRAPVGGLFSRAVSSLFKSSSGPPKREAVKEGQQQAADWGGETEGAGSPTGGVSQAASPPRAPAPTREVLEEAEESFGSPAPEAKTPGRRTRRRESSDSLGGQAPTDLTVIQCKNIPPHLNKKDLIEQHFGQFGKICKVLCRPNKNLAIVHFQDHGSAAKAKKRGKMMKHQELLLLWQRKKHSPGDGAGRPAEDEEQQGGERLGPKASSSSSPLSRPPPRTLTVSSTTSTLSRSSPVKKPSIVKSLQFDAEPQQTPSQESQSSDRLVPSSLLPLIGQLAESAEEKYRLLEQRDKILRQGRPKRTDLVLSKVFVGTCPDMCPEKERYMRETRNQLSSYELVPNTEMVDHTAAIKEYSRSSADQEEPLPHELRPLPVLSRTMDYLVTQVMDLGQDNLRDWYDFVWNRTRGIRKDITQQHLCCPSTVALIEKCTRFHVHCAHHLCEEPMMTFDAKINNENMTKCLQSLKEMYEDLQTRQIHCPHEAEFRQYHVLLNLNEGDILREVQQLRDEVRNSPEVKFAVQAFTALNSNNFVRFFKLLKGASYLASCLLHRYFNQVRAKALRTLNFAHTVNSQRSTCFPVEDVVRMLMFPDAGDASHFLQQYGLSVSDCLVELSRPSYQEPELSVPQKRSEVIMGKRTMLIGEVVNGGPLPSPPVHTPVCSFDSHHRYRGEGPPAETTSLRAAPSAAPVFPPKQEVKVLSEVQPQPQATPPQEGQASPASLEAVTTDETGEPQVPVARVPSPPPPKPQPVYSDEDILAEVEGVVKEVVEAEVSEVASSAASYTTTALQESDGQMEALVSEVVDHMLQEMSASEVQLEQERVAEEKRTQEEARRRQEHEAFLAQFSVCLCAEVVQEVLGQSIQETASAEIQAALKEKSEREARCTEQVCTALVEDTLDTDITLLVESILEAELQRIHKYIKRWRDVVAVRRQLKRQMRDFPAAPCCVDPHFKLKALAPSAPPRPSLADLARGLVDLGNAGTLTLSSTRLLKMRREVVHKMRVHYYYQRLLDESAWTPLDLPALVTENIPNAPDRIFWKAVLLLPSDQESEAALGDRVLSDWLEVKFGGREGSEVKEKPTDGSLQSLCLTNELHEHGQRTHKVHISIKVSRGPLSEDALSRAEEDCELNATAALLMLLPAPLACPGGREDEEVPLLSALLQLRQLQQASAWHRPVPLAILVPGLEGSATSSQKLEEALMLKALVEDGLISEYIFLDIPETTSDLQGSEQLSQAVRWLVGHAPSLSPALSVQTLVQFVESGLSREFTSRLCSHRQDRVEAGLPSQDPSAVVQLYNGVLEHLAEAVSSSQLSSLSWPPGEFAPPAICHLMPPLGWNGPQHLAWLRTAVLSLQLPPWESPAAHTSWSELCASISSYSSQIPVSPLSGPLLTSRLDNLLERVRRRAQSGGPPALQVPWDDLVLLCVDHKLKDWTSPTPPICQGALTEDGQILVYFSTEALKGFQPPEEWTQGLNQTHREKHQETHRASPSAGASSPSLRQRLFQSPKGPSEPQAAQLDITQTPSAQELLPLKVLQGLEEEKILSQRSTEQLQRWLDADPLDSLSMPLFLPSSTLLSMPPIMVATRPARHTQQAEADEPAEKAFWPKGTRVSMTQRLKDIERQIEASQEEELACRLTLSGLLGVVDD